MAERLVLDANVAIKWFIRDTLESDCDKADQILLAHLNGDVELVAPGIFIHEVCGALTKACGHRLPGTSKVRLQKSHALECVKELFRLAIRIESPSEAEAIESMDMAVTFAKGHYDMTYLRLAQNLDCKWCTADEKLMLANPAQFPVERLLLLSAV